MDGLAVGVATDLGALMAEVEQVQASLDAPAARLLQRGQERLVRLDEVEALLASKIFLVDGCRHEVRHGVRSIPLQRRPVLLTLARTLAEAWPRDATREELVARAFRMKQADDSQRARLRVEIGRLRRLLRSVAGIDSAARKHACPGGEPRGVVAGRHQDLEPGSAVANQDKRRGWSRADLRTVGHAVSYSIKA